MKKIILVFVSVFLLLLLPSCGKAKESPVEDFEYEMVEGEVTITKYIGSDLEVYIPEKINDRPVTVIGEEAFAEYDMTYVSMPDSVVYIEEDAFSNCVCLSKVSFSKNLTEIGWGAFGGCNSLVTVDFPDSLYIIGGGAFSYCESLAEIKLPSALSEIESYAFENCLSLSSVKLPEGLKYLGRDSFANCENLEELKIPVNTEIAIEADHKGDAQYGITYTVFSSPVGGSSAFSGDFDDWSYGENLNKTFKELHTVLIVSKDSYAYSQIRQISGDDCLEYGLSVRVEG